MQAERALADLIEISPQIEAATVFDGEGETLGSVGVSDWWATAVARTGRSLLDAAAGVRGDGDAVTQLHASLGDGDVFAVRGTGERTIVAVTASRQAQGLVFYDLKRCLVRLNEGEDERESQPDSEPEAAPKQRRRRWGRKEREADEA